MTADSPKGFECAILNYFDRKIFKILGKRVGKGAAKTIDTYHFLRRLINQIIMIERNVFDDAFGQFEFLSAKNRKGFAQPKTGNKFNSESEAEKKKTK